MANNEIFLSGMTAADLVELFRPMIQDEVKRIKDAQPEKLLSPSETCKMFHPSISKVTLTAWTNAGRLQDHRIGGRIYYKESEVLASLTSLRKYKN